MASQNIERLLTDIALAIRNRGPVFTNPYKCSVCLSTSQLNLVDNTWTKVLLDSVIYDPNSNFSSYAYTVPISGYYAAHWQAVFTTTVLGKLYDVALFVNGASVRDSSVLTSAANSVWVHSSDNIYLSAGDVITLYVRSHSAVNTTDLASGQSYTKLSLHLLSI
jgi:hypothetical protein